MKHLTVALLLCLLIGCSTAKRDPLTSRDLNIGAPANVLCGIDVLVRDAFKQLAGRKIAIITNHTGLDRDGNRTIDLLVAADKVNVVKLFSPEHGLYGELDEKVGHGRDRITGLPVYSLYGDTRKPTAEMLDGIDTLVFDIQDIGTRFYTYISTMGLCMEAAAEHGVKMVVLDRPNPINGLAVEGPIADEKHLGFIAYHPIPLRHGMTVGELAHLFNTERAIGCDLTVIELENWRRDMWFDATGLMWVNPSPNMRNLTQALVYPGVGLLEAARQVSVGRGTDQPFEVFGAPWINGRRLAAALNAARLPGLRFVPITFTPDSSTHANKRCQGVYIIVTDRDRVRPVAAGVTVAWTLEHLFGPDYELDTILRMLQDDATMQAIRTAIDPGAIPDVWRDELDAFQTLRLKYLLYP